MTFTIRESHKTRSFRHSTPLEVTAQPLKLFWIQLCVCAKNDCCSNISSITNKAKQSRPGGIRFLVLDSYSMNFRSGLSLFSKNPRRSPRPSATATAALWYFAASTVIHHCTGTFRSSRSYFASAMVTATAATTAAATSVAAPTKDPRFRTWPITSTKSLEPMLRDMGLELDANAIDGTSAGTGTALSDALVSVGTAGRGGTGSFVSKQGLIVTNWHVAYDAVRRASIDASDDYVRDGFVARSLKQEIEGPNYECWITEACLDVSDTVLESISGGTLDPLERANTIRNVRQEIAQAAQEEASSAAESGGTRCDVVEMIPNKSYVLFTYKRLRDVRIVYVPPKSLGNFGGDIDNFEWPRHTADFTLLRAYVPPATGGGSWDGYHADNVPYDSSKSFIRVRKPSPETDISENDMVFLLGFPGSTMRYAPTPRLKYADTVAVPHMVQDFTRKLQLIANHEGHSSEAALKLGSTKKGLANELKRSKGKLVMMRKLKLLPERAAEEAKLTEVAQVADGEQSVQQILARLEEIYGTFEKDHPTSSTLDSLRGIYGGSALLAAGHAIHEFVAHEQGKPDSERETSYRKRNLPFLAKRLTKRLRDVHLPHEAELVSDCASLLGKLKASNAADDNDKTLSNCLDSIQETILQDCESAKDAVVGETASSKLLTMSTDPSVDVLSEIFADEGSPTEAWLEDPFVRVAACLWDVYKRDRDSSKALLSERDSLLAKLLEYQQQSAEEDCYPDCNGSLRISAGFVEGYKAADAIFHTPHTTLSGLLDKATETKLSGDGEAYEDSVFHCPERLYKLLEEDTTGEGVQKVPVCLLYSTDTVRNNPMPKRGCSSICIVFLILCIFSSLLVQVGGNSGSPVMNQRGELVAINFDRQRQGLMNEYKWSSNYSRSIGVDVRYILWLIGDYDGATHLVDELIAGDA